MKKMSGMDRLTSILTILGAINWGLVGIFDYNLINSILGGVNILERVVYALVGVSGIWVIFAWSRCCKKS